MVSQFKNLQNLEFLRKVRLEPIVTNYNSRFSLTTLRGQFILLTGGIGPGNQSSKQVLLYDKESRKMKKLPNLTLQGIVTQAADRAQRPLYLIIGTLSLYRLRC